MVVQVMVCIRDQLVYRFSTHQGEAYRAVVYAFFGGHDAVRMAPEPMLEVEAMLELSMLDGDDYTSALERTR